MQAPMFVLDVFEPSCSVQGFEVFDAASEKPMTNTGIPSAFSWPVGSVASPHLKAGLGTFKESVTRTTAFVRHLASGSSQRCPAQKPSTPPAGTGQLAKLNVQGEFPPLK